MTGLQPNAEAIEHLTADPSEGRYATVLLISYCSDERYTAWLDAVMPRLDAVGARIVWAGNDAAPVIGDPDRHWDAIAVVEYPSLDAFFELVRDPGWAEVDDLRVAAMDTNEVYACTPLIDALNHG